MLGAADKKRRCWVNRVLLDLVFFELDSLVFIESTAGTTEAIGAYTHVCYAYESECMYDIYTCT